MTLIDEVKQFARDYVNIPAQRTREHKAKIAEAYRSITGRNLRNGCSTCYIEAVFKILKYNPMTSKYEIKRGAVVQVFGHPEKAVTNNTITDEIGDWYVKYHPEKLKFFVRYPKVAPVIIPPPVAPVIKAEAVKTEVHSGITIEQVPLIAEIEQAQKEVIKKKPVKRSSKVKR